MLTWTAVWFSNHAFTNATSESAANLGSLVVFYWTMCQKNSMLWSWNGPLARSSQSTRCDISSQVGQQSLLMLHFQKCSLQAATILISHSIVPASESHSLSLNFITL